MATGERPSMDESVRRESRVGHGDIVGGHVRPGVGHVCAVALGVGQGAEFVAVVATGFEKAKAENKKSIPSIV